MVHWAHVQKINIIEHPDLWRQQLWQIDGFSALHIRRLDVFAEWRLPKAPVPVAMPREPRARAAHLRALMKTSYAWAVRVVPLQPIEADPFEEGLEVFLLRARKHYERRAADLTARGFSPLQPSQIRPSLALHAGWWLRRVVGREFVRAITESPCTLEVPAVERAIRRFAELAALPRAPRGRPTSRAAHGTATKKTDE